MSFIQIYLETIQVCAYRRLQCVLRRAEQLFVLGVAQDLFAPESYQDDGNLPENLAVREDPRHGFYVEGLRV